MATKKQSKKKVSIPIKVKGKEIFLGRRKYTFTSLFIMTFLSELVSLAAIVVSVLNLQVNGSKAILFLVASIFVFLWAFFYEQVLRKARKMSGRKTFIASLIEKIWGPSQSELVREKMEKNGKL